MKGAILMVAVMAGAAGCAEKKVPDPAPVAKPENCRVVTGWAAMVILYCPENTDPKSLGAWLASTEKEHAEGTRMRQVHYFVFSNEEKAPTSITEFQALEGTDFNRLLIGRASFNHNTGHRSYDCKTEPSQGEVGDCRIYLPRKRN